MKSVMVGAAGTGTGVGSGSSPEVESSRVIPM